MSWTGWRTTIYTALAPRRCGSALLCAALRCAATRFLHAGDMMARLAVVLRALVLVL
eukprot:COSAG02_NODE_21852_length_773_cov_0.615727_1_plen_56_part_01